MPTLIDTLDGLTSDGVLYETVENQSVRCVACANRCLIRPGQRGICKVRFNHNGVLRVPWGYVISAQTDPIEKKPFSHLLPGSNVLTFGMLGCNFHCSFCQNWQTSQTLRDPVAGVNPDYLQKISPDQLVKYALETGANLIASSYNEPLITTEWAVEIFRLAQQAGLKCAYVSNGFATSEVLHYLKPYLTALKVDLKTMQEKQYRDLGGKLEQVLESIRLAYQLGLWVEVVTLIIPGFNDSTEELWEAARFLASISTHIPWHVTAYHPDYRMNEHPPTPASTLQRAAEIGQEAGLYYVYAGNLPGRVGSLEDTFCPGCQTRLVKRQGYSIIEYSITNSGKCPQCGIEIAGVWTDQPKNVHLSGPGIPKRVRW